MRRLPTARAIIRHVDDFRAVHNLDSVAQRPRAYRLGTRLLTTRQGMSWERAAPATPA